MSVRVHSAPWVLTGRGGGALADGAVALDGDTIVAVGPRAEVEARHGEGERHEAVLLPALVNAHLHLELSHLAGAVAGGEGLPAWIELFVSARARARDRDPAPAMTMGAEDLLRFGVAAVGDVSNTLGSLAPLAAAGLAGTIFLEVFGVTPRRMAEALDVAKALRAAAPAPPPGLRVVTSPHAVYSTHHPSLVELLRAGPGSIHLAEDAAERAFVSTGSGAFGHLVARMGGRARELVPKGRSAVAVDAPYLAPHHLVVHCVDVDEDDLALLRSAGVTAVLCPRSNGFITGKLPPLAPLLAAALAVTSGARRGHVRAVGGRIDPDSGQSQHGSRDLGNCGIELGVAQQYVSACRVDHNPGRGRRVQDIQNRLGRFPIRLRGPENHCDQRQKTAHGCADPP